MHGTHDVEAAIKYYNANSRDSRVGDCVIRSISLALGKSYDQTRAELNKVKRELHTEAYNVPRVFEKYLRDNGAEDRVYSIVNDQITVQEFYDSHPEGTYLLLVDSSKKKSPDQKKTGQDHMCCIVNGDLYDSWDSRSAIVTSYYKLPTNPAVREDVDIDVIEDPLVDAVESYLAQLSFKYRDYGTLDFGLFRRQDQYTAIIRIKCYINTDNLSVANFYRLSSEFSHKIVVKISPTYTDDDLPRIIKSVKQKIYDWWYMIYKEIKDFEDSRSFTANPHYRGDKTKLMQLPEWCRPLVTYYKNDGNTNYTDKFCVYMDALPDDPRAETDPEVGFYADTLTELKQNLEDYRTKYLRFNYDY